MEASRSLGDKGGPNGGIALFSLRRKMVDSVDAVFLLEQETDMLDVEKERKYTRNNGFWLANAGINLLSFSASSFLLQHRCHHISFPSAYTPYSPLCTSF